MLIASLLIGVVSTILIVFTGIEKEHHWDLLRESSNEKVAGLQLETAKANAALGAAQADIAKAHTQAAEAMARAAEANQKAEEERLARVKIEERIAPRRIPKSSRTN